jgi:farnesyl diphosphate synthase
MMTEPELLFGAWKQRVEDVLSELLPAAGTQPSRLHTAMRYAALGPGKRVRPLLVYAAGTLCGAALEDLDRAACAVELIHAYSLVHDDLPAMDDDDLRRGRPTCHRYFDEATAILVGDALQTLAFQLLADQVPEGPAAPRVRLQMIGELAMAAGSRGMAGGQAMDMDATGIALSVPQLESMHIHKTGALIRASVRLGALPAEPAAEVIEQLDHFAKCVGLAYQVQDDILDVEGASAVIGKTQGKDAAAAKATFPGLIGLDESRMRARELLQSGLASLERFGADAEPLRALGVRLVERHR